MIEVNGTSANLSNGSPDSNASSEDHPLVRSLRAILRQLDEACESLRTALPNTSVKDQALAMSKARHLERWKNYARELSALLDGTG